MTREEAVKMLQATRLMLMDGANQPISDLYYALDMAIEALEQTEPQIVGKHADVIIIDEPQTCNDCDQQRCEICVTEIGKDEPQTERSRR